MDDSKLMDAMKVYLATNFTFYLKLHFFHWNIEGSDFPQYHKFLEKLYEEVFEAHDTIAEHIRALQGYAPGSLSRYAQLTEIKDQVDTLPAQLMIKMAMADNEIVLKTIRNAYNLAEAAGEIGVSNFLQDRYDVHTKHGWMLRATSK
jgi:starvation-inducible DNA-binding protein